MTKPYTLADRKRQPAVLLPPEARKRLIEEYASIKRCYKQPILRAQALDHFIDKLRIEHPEAFHADV